MTSDVPAVVKSHTPGNVFGGGTTIVNYTATDLAGNANYCLMDITVTGITLGAARCGLNSF